MSHGERKGAQICLNTIDSRRRYLAQCRSLLEESTGGQGVHSRVAARLLLGPQNQVLTSPRRMDFFVFLKPEVGIHQFKIGQTNKSKTYIYLPRRLRMPARACMHASAGTGVRRRRGPSAWAARALSCCSVMPPRSVVILVRIRPDLNSRKESMW